MKRLLVILLILLLLTGCGTEGNMTSATDTGETTQPVPTGLYNPNSKAEQLAKGAVRAYPLGSGNYIAMEAIGNKLLLVSDKGELTLLAGDLCEKTATIVTGTSITSGSLGFSVAQTGVAYYVSSSREVVLLNPQLQETGRYALPEDVQGTPAISVSNNEAYYCVGQEIRALDLQTKIERKIRVQESAELELTGCYFEGQVLAFTMTQSEGEHTKVYISSETGQTLSEDQNIFAMQTDGVNYFLQRMDGYVQQLIFGTMMGAPQSLVLPEGSYHYVTGALQQNAVLSYLTMEDGIRFSFHDYVQGKTTAQMLLPQVEAPAAMTAGKDYVWIIAAHAGTNKQVLYRWDATQTAAEEEIASVSPLYTAQMPDEDGLKLQQEHVDAYNEKYGVRIAIWENAVKQTGGYSAVAEYQTGVISNMLTNLEPVFTLFPENFLRYTVRNGWIRICLVRSISSGESWAQFWEDGDCYILLTPVGDIADSFLQAVSYAVDTNVLGNSRDFDTWSELNPADFTYDYSYDVYQDREDLSLTQGEKRAFVDSRSMTYPHEDRCRVFYYAITDGHEEVFTSKFMQNKLQKLCEGIREAYGLEKKDASYVWEQYLIQEMDYSYT